MASDFGGYERAGKGTVATEGEIENKFATYELNDPNPEQTEAMKQHIRKIEQEKAEILGPDDSQPGQKGGLLQKLRRGSKDKNEASTGRRRSSATAPLPAEPHHGDVTQVSEGSNPDAAHLFVKDKS